MRTHRQNTQLYPVGEGVRELHEVALTLVIIVHSERMSHSEPRKPLNFPQGGRKKEWAKWVKGGGRGQMERGKKKEWQNVCQMRKGGKMKRIIRFPAVLHWLLKSPFAAAAPPFPFNPTPPRPQTTNTVREPVSSLATASSFPHGQSFWIQWTWNESIQVSASVWKSMLGYDWWKNLMLVSVGCCYANVFVNQCVPAGFSVTCCMSLVLMTSIRHDKVPPSSGMYIGPRFLSTHKYTNWIVIDTESLSNLSFLFSLIYFKPGQISPK